MVAGFDAVVVPATRQSDSGHFSKMIDAGAEFIFEQMISSDGDRTSSKFAQKLPIKVEPLDGFRSPPDIIHGDAYAASSKLQYAFERVVQVADDRDATTQGFQVRARRVRLAMAAKEDVNRFLQVRYQLASEIDRTMEFYPWLQIRLRDLQEDGLPQTAIAKYLKLHPTVQISMQVRDYRYEVISAFHGIKAS
jgi:hypothetical protein